MVDVAFNLAVAQHHGGAFIGHDAHDQTLVPLHDETYVKITRIAYLRMTRHFCMSNMPDWMYTAQFIYACKGK